VTAIAVTLNPNKVMYENTMDSLNFFCRERMLSRELRIKLRDFLNAARHVNQLNKDTELVEKFSPMLQGHIALAANRQWLDQIWFFSSLWQSRDGIEFISAVAKALRIRNYTVNERLPIGQLYIMRRGICVKLWRFIGPRRTWGEDSIMLQSSELIDHSQAVALCYVEVYTLRRRAFNQVLEEHPVAEAAVRLAVRRITIQRALLKYLVQSGGKRGPSSFIMRSMATDPDVVDDVLTSDQRVDTVFSGMKELAHDLVDRDKRLRAELRDLKEMVRAALPEAKKQIAAEKPLD
jgi:hypothetical protein